MIRKLYPFILQDGKEKITIECPSASRRESIERYDMLRRKNRDEIQERARLLIEKYGKIEAKDKKKFKKKLLSQGLYSIIEKATETIHRQHKSIYEGVSLGENKFRRKKDTPPGVIDILISQNVGLSVVELDEKLTLEEYGIYQDAIIYNSLEGTEKGRKTNTMYRHNRKTDKQIKEGKEHLQKLKKALQKNKGGNVKVKIKK